MIYYNWAAVCKKVPNVLSLCHTKGRYDTDFSKKNIPNFSKKFEKVGVIPKEGGRVTHPSIFWYDQKKGGRGPFGMTATFQKKKSKIFTKKFEKSVSYQKKDGRDLFA